MHLLAALLFVYAGTVSATQEPVVDSGPQTYVFVCANQSAYTVRAGGTEARVFRPEPDFDSAWIQEVGFH